MTEPILSVRDLVKHFPITRGVLFRRTIGQVRAVDGVSLDLHPGETLGVVGESGCGKSTLAQVLMRLIPPTGGTATFEGEDLFAKRGAALTAWRRDMQIVLQDPYTSLNPRKTVGDIVGEPFDIHPEVAPKGDRQRRVQELLEVVGLNPEHIRRYPHQFSGGQRQRIGIARALALRPKVIVCDEPVSALDVSIQAQVLNLLGDLQREFGLAYLFIAHDLGVVRHLCDRVAVMYLGSIVETGSAEEIYQRASHPYTQALLSSVPVPDPSLRGRREAIRLDRRRAEPRGPALGLPLPHAVPEGPARVRGGAPGARGPGVHRPPRGVPLRRAPAPGPDGVAPIGQRRTVADTERPYRHALDVPGGPARRALVRSDELPVAGEHPRGRPRRQRPARGVDHRRVGVDAGPVVGVDQVHAHAGQPRPARGAVEALDGRPARHEAEGDVEVDEGRHHLRHQRPADTAARAGRGPPRRGPRRRRGRRVRRAGPAGTGG